MIRESFWSALSRGKVNALNETAIDEMTGCFKELAADAGVRAIILTGTGKFFTFGFDIPEFLSYPRESFIRYLTKFTDLCTYLFLYPKPVVAAIAQRPHNCRRLYARHRLRLQDHGSRKGQDLPQ